jgi:hypothetical protein
MRICRGWGVIVRMEFLMCRGCGWVTGMYAYVAYMLTRAYVSHIHMCHIYVSPMHTNIHVCIRVTYCTYCAYVSRITGFYLLKAGYYLG